MRKIVFILILLTSVVHGDTIILNDGTRIVGDVKRNGGDYIITLPDGTTQRLVADSVKSITLGEANKSSDDAAAGLASLRRSVESQNDLNTIVQRYQHFIDATKDAKTQADAKADLQTWISRRDAGFVKHGGRWISKDDAVAATTQAGATAITARDLLRQNKTREADQLLAEAFDADPTNAAVLYLRGVEQYRQDKLPEARKSFEAANMSLAQSPHAPTLNNLGVILWRQNQQNGALIFFDRAMQAEPVNLFILNNVAESLAALPDDQKKSPNIAKVIRRFTEQDLLLQQQMAQRGLFRWGSTWVDQKRLDELRGDESKVREKLQTMQSEFDQTKSRIAQIDTEVAANEREMGDISIRSIYTDSTGKTVYLPMPQSYYELKSKNQSLKSEQTGLRTKLTSMQEQARHEQTAVPTPQFSGVQQIVGVEGMPGEMNASQATTPSIDVVKPATTQAN